MRRIVRAIRSSPQRRQRFLNECFPLSTPQNSRLLPVFDNATRWSSTFLMIERFLTLRKAIGTYVNLEENLNSLNYRQDSLYQDDWHRLELLHSILDPFKRASTALQTAKSPMITLVNFIHKQLNDSIERSRETL